MANYDDEDMPKTARFIFTSEENSYGANYRFWLDGTAFEHTVKLHQQDTVHLRPQEYTYLDNRGAPILQKLSNQKMEILGVSI